MTSIATETPTAAAPLLINGKVVTEANAWRFVKQRQPNARVRRERAGWRGGCLHIVEAAGAGWCSASGKTAGAAWMRAARNMIAHDAKVAADREAMNSVIGKLRVAAMNLADRPLVEPGPQFALEAAALRYAAERLRQGQLTYGTERNRLVEGLLDIAAKMETP